MNDYKLKNGKILKNGHTMFLEDAVKDLKRGTYLETLTPNFMIEIDCEECGGSGQKVCSVKAKELDNEDKLGYTYQTCPTCKGNKTVLSPLKAELTGTLKEGE